MSRKAEQKQRSHDAIIASAAALLRARGIDASSVGEVMRGAGLTVGGFYGHFSSKEELFVETIRSAAGLMWDGLLASAGGQSPRAKVLSVARRYMSRAHRDQPEMGCLLPSIAAEVARAGEPYRGALASEVERFAESFGALLGSGAEAKRAALGLIALMYGALSLSRALAGTPLSDELLVAAERAAEALVGR